jgi:hypothetical protein
MSDTKTYLRLGTLIVLLLLLCGAIGGNVWQYLYGLRRIRDADERYGRAERDFTEQFDRLKSDLTDARTSLGRAEALNSAARTSVGRITAELDGNIRSVQEAKRIISNIRAAVAEMEAGLLVGDRRGGGAGLDGGVTAGAVSDG